MQVKAQQTYYKEGQQIAKLSDTGALRRCCADNFIDVAMEIDLIFKVAAIGIIVSILNQVLAKSGREEQATMTTLTGLVVVLMMVASKISELFELVKSLFHF